MDLKIKKKAASLAEVMIVLGIISTTLVASVSILINSLSRTKVNEIEDAANAVMIQALEVAKSPAQNVSVSSTSFAPNQRGEVYSFKLNKSIDGENVLEEIRQPSTEGCNSQSPYYVTPDNRTDVTQEIDLCLQITVENISNQVYEIVSTVTYQIPNEEKQNTIKGYRYGEF